MNKMKIFQLLCDLTCKLEGTEQVGDQHISATAKALGTSEILGELIKESGKNFGKDLVRWVDWYAEGLADHLTKDQVITLQFIKVTGRIRKIEGQ
jgi:hypothetical protein